MKKLHRIKWLLMILGIYFSIPTVAADISLIDLQGKHIPFSTLSGKWVFINYWATWCKSCMAEIPELNRFYEANKGRDVVLFAVNYDALPLNRLKNLIQHLNIHYPSLQEDPSLALGLGDILGVPVTFVFNPKGKLTYQLYGGQTLASLQRVLAK